jgi:glycyl-tRNA synthetase
MNIEEMATFCKKKGFVFRSADIYGGLSGFFDYAPLGVLLKKKIEDNWFKFIVEDRQNVVAQDGSLITNPKVWEASGHLDNFADLVLTTKLTKKKMRADHFIEEQLDINAEGLSAEEINELIKKHNLTYKGEEFEEVKGVNTMFSTKVGSSDTNVYLRPETCQNIFPNFKLIMETTRQKLPFGIAQIGKAFRNEISARDFLFRLRELGMMELEFFIHPDEKECRVLEDKHRGLIFQFLSATVQDEKKHEMEQVSLQQLLDRKLLTEWHAYWLAEMYRWYLSLGFKPDNLRFREHMKTELSHYSSATFDLDYKFPFGFKEVLGIANRGDYDLKQHSEHSGEKLEYFDELSGKKVIPQVIEPSQGIDRLFLALMFESYDDSGDHVVLHLPKSLAPYHCAVFPLVKNKPELLAKAEDVYEMIRKYFSCFFDMSGSVGRRYARADEIGTPYCITVDFESLEDDCVTIRDRDTAKQRRVKISNLKEELNSK